MNINIVELPEYRIAFFRHVGSYLDTGKNWENLLQWVEGKNLFRTNPLFIGISRDDPAVTEEDACRHDACITLPTGFAEDSDGSGVSFDVIPPGKYAQYEFYDTKDKLGLAYRNLFSEWLPQSDYEIDDRVVLSCDHHALLYASFVSLGHYGSGQKQIQTLEYLQRDGGRAGCN